jgi:chromosome condensin MukBEF ATPase and DNA-binding subunit MukB
MDNGKINSARITHLEKVVANGFAEQDARHRERMRAVEHDIKRLQELIDAKMTAQAIALEKSEAAYNARFANANEFRASLEDFSKRSVTRDYVDTRFNALVERISALESRLSNFDGRIIGYSAGIGAVVLIIAIILQFLEIGI